MSAMNETIETLKERWQQLSRREQILAVAGSLSITVWLFWQLIVNPLADRQILAEKRLAAKEQQLQNVMQQANEIVTLQASGSTPQALRNTPMDRVINQTAPEFKLTIERVKNLQNGLDVAISLARFDQLLDWLIKLEQDSGIQVADLQVNVTETAGIVEIKRLQLERG